MLGFCSNEAKKPLPREAVRTLVVLGVAYAMVRVWYTLAVNMHGLAGDAVQVAAIMGGYGFVAVWSRVGIDLAIALLAPRIKTLWKRRWVGVLGASMLVLATAILFYAGSTGSYAPMAALVCALCYGAGSDLLYLTWSEAFTAYDDRALNAAMLFKTGLDALFSPLFFAPRAVVFAVCLTAPALSAVGLAAAPRLAEAYGARPQRRWHAIDARSAAVLAVGVVVLFFSFSFSQSSFMTDGQGNTAWFVIAGRWLTFGLMVAGVVLSRDFHFEMFYRLAVMTAIVGFLVRMLEVPGSYPVYLVASIASTRVAEDATVMVLVSVARYSTARPLSVLAWGRVVFRLGGWAVASGAEFLLGHLEGIPGQTVLGIACAAEIVLLAVAGMWLLSDRNINAFLWGRGAAEGNRSSGTSVLPGPDGAPSEQVPSEATLVIPPRCRWLASSYNLTERETDVLALLLDGRSVPYIQETLHVSANTAKTHIRHIYQKLDVHNRQDLITLAQGAPV